jgi:acetoin utilization deacetylase AcuC-like enzyme
MACLPDNLDNRLPESPDRLARLLSALKENTAHWSLHETEPSKEPPESWAPHPPAYWQSLRAALANDEPYFHARDVRLGPHLLPSLAGAAGALAVALDATLKQAPHRSFAAVRPASHHASANEAMGFCILNLAAYAAERAKRLYNLKRIAILDWDAHHGNGTDEITKNDPSCLFISWHQDPYYPFTGANRGTLEGASRGENLSIAFPSGSQVDAYEKSYDTLVTPALRAFNPELIIISCGFDAHRLDPMSELSLESQDYRTLTERLLASTGAPILSILEGGYYVPALIESARFHLEALAVGE